MNREIVGVIEEPGNTELEERKIERIILEKIFSRKNDLELLGAAGASIDRCVIEAFEIDGIVLLDVIDKETNEKMYFLLDAQNRNLIGDLRKYPLKTEEMVFLIERARKQNAA